MTTPATQRALEHADRLAHQWLESGEPTQEEWMEAARDVAELLPSPAGPAVDLALTIASLSCALYHLFVETRDDHAAALGSVAGAAAYKAMQGAGR